MPQMITVKHVIASSRHTSIDSSIVPSVLLHETVILFVIGPHLLGVVILCPGGGYFFIFHSEASSIPAALFSIYVCLLPHARSAATHASEIEATHHHHALLGPSALSARTGAPACFLRLLRV